MFEIAIASDLRGFLRGRRRRATPERASFIELLIDKERRFGK
jgi:hypothetical protein